MNVAIDDIDEAITKETFQGMLWGEDRLWSPLMGGEDFWPVALRLVPARSRTAEQAGSGMLPRSVNDMIARIPEGQSALTERDEAWRSRARIRWFLGGFGIGIALDFVVTAAQL